MRVFVAVNRVNEIGYRQTTALLIASLVRNGWDVRLAHVGAFSIAGGSDSNRHFVSAVKVTVADSSKCDSTGIESLVQSSPGTITTDLAGDDLILIRSNPGRDIERIATHDSFLDFCRSAQANGIRVINDPASVRFFASKAALTVLDPAHRPQMVVSSDVQVIADFVLSAGVDCVVKPVIGSRGQGVIRVDANAKNTLDLISDHFQDQGMVAQHFVHSEEPGDKRVVVVGGEILEKNGNVGGIHRRPAAGDFRANIHAGGSAHPLSLDEEERESVEHAARYLHQNGIWLAGIDLIGSKIIEFNVYSTGGLFDANQFSGLRFEDAIVAGLMQ